MWKLSGNWLILPDDKKVQSDKKREQQFIAAMPHLFMSRAAYPAVILRGT
jgi:hypothetical protein